MITEIGLLFLLFALGLLGAGLCPWGYLLPVSHRSEYFFPMFIQAILALSVAMLILLFAFLSDDFGLRYVYQNSSLQLPVWFKLTALWSSHEGSWLLWTVLSVFNAARLQRTIQRYSCYGFNFVPLSIILFAYVAYQVFTSNPFTRILPIAPGDGVDMNPLLQDTTFMIHPPCLYLGLCAMIVPFTLVCNSEKLRDPRLYMLLKSWVFWSWGWLTVGIMLGSYWAYHELGWGGWWFWDPVENAALMPWLTMTILIHFLSVKRSFISLFWVKHFTVLTFLLTILGTWITRSGVFVSVHGFATSPNRGYFLLFVVFLSFVLPYCSQRLSPVSSRLTRNHHCLIQERHWLYWHTVSITLVCLAIVFGLFMPFLFEALGFDRITVTAQYYATTVEPLIISVILLMIIFTQSAVQPIYALFCLIATLLVTCGLVSYYSSLVGVSFFHLSIYHWLMLIGMCFGTLSSIIQLCSQSFRWVHMTHGLICFLGACIVINQAFSQERLLQLRAPFTYNEPHLHFQLAPASVKSTDNYLVRDFHAVLHWHKMRGLLRPSLRHYRVRDTAKSVADIQHAVLYDMMVVVSQIEPDHYVVRLYVKPLQSVFWMIGFLLALITIFRAVILSQVCHLGVSRACKSSN